MKFLFIILGFTIKAYLFAQVRLSDDDIYNLYKSSDIIFTAVVIHKNIKANTIGETELIDFDITEIQKGKDYSRLMVYVANDTIEFEKGKEYLVFAKKSKDANNHYECIFAEMVCKSCVNYTIKKIYSIVDKRFFGRIRKPREKTSWHERGCGCF